jgi:ABC-type antimicrobial peptide transport system permease subunit
VSWLVGTTVRRWRAQWRLIAAVLSVTILSCTLVTALGLLVTTTEQNGVSSALAEFPDSQSRIDLTLLDPGESVDETRGQVESKVGSLLGPSAQLETTTFAVSGLLDVNLESENPVATYVGEFDEIENLTELVEGHWADVATPLAIAVPEAAATSFDLQVGDVLTVDTAEVTIAAIYRPLDSDAAFWNSDILGGNGDDPAFPRPGIMDYEPIHVFGPLVVAPGGLAAADIRATRLEFTVVPDLSGTTVAELEPLTERLEDFDFEVRQQLGSVSASLFFESELREGVRAVAAGLIVTRSTVVVVSLLLLVLAIAAIGQTARLLADARATDRQLMRSRGASSSHVVSIAIVEAIVIGIVTALLSPLLAGLVYRAFAATPAAVDAGIPAAPQLTAFAWITAAAASLIFVVVLVVPLLARGSATSDAAQSRGRYKTARTGVDIALLVVAGVAYAQLRSYESPVDTDASLAIDPILVVGPAIVLIAGAFACVRVLPLVARLVAKIGSRAKGIVAPLAAWEIGRRPQRASTAVLLLSLALAVGTFSLSFLATWQQSQVDQASLAVGPPGRLLADDGVDAAPVFRTPGRLGASADDVGVEFGGSGRGVQVLALSKDARALLERGRLSELGGRLIDDGLAAETSESAGIDLPGDVNGLTATVRLGDPTLPPLGVTATLVAILEDESGVLHPVNWEEVPVDGLEHEVEGVAALADVRIVGFTATFIMGQGFERAQSVPVAIDDLGVIRDAEKGAESAEPVEGTSAGWYAVNDQYPPAQVASSNGNQVAFDAILPGDYSTFPSIWAFVGWEPAPYLLAVIPTEVAVTESLAPPEHILLFAGGATVVIEIAGDVDVAPGSAPYDEVSAGNVGGLTSVVVDHTLFERALVESGSTRSFADEWWVDVADGAGAAFARDNPDAVSSEALGISLQQSPLRIATPMALWLTILAGALLATIGFAMHTTTGLRSRRLELAQLAAIGVPKPKLLALVTIESLITGLLGAILGAALGILVALLIGPLVASSPDGNPPVPSVIVQLPWLQFVLLDVGIALVLAAVVLAVGRGRSFAQPADLLRWGGE